MTNPVQGNQAVFPPLQSPLVQDDGTGQLSQMATPWYLLFRTMFARTGGGTGAPSLVPQVTNDTGASQASATPLIPGVAFVNGSGGGVVAAAQQAGQFTVVFNVGGSNTNVYPPAGAQINALGVNAPFVVPNGKCQIFFWQTATQLRTMTFA
jgi:hypothetical protein